MFTDHQCTQIIWRKKNPKNKTGSLKINVYFIAMEAHGVDMKSVLHKPNKFIDLSKTHSNIFQQRRLRVVIFCWTLKSMFGKVEAQILLRKLYFVCFSAILITSPGSSPSNLTASHLPRLCGQLLCYEPAFKWQLHIGPVCLCVLHTRRCQHRETCFSVRVDAHYKFMFDSGSIIWAAHRFYVCSSISFCFTYCYVRQTKLDSSLDNVWTHYKIVIDCVIEW